MVAFLEISSARCLDADELLEVADVFDGLGGGLLVNGFGKITKGAIQRKKSPI
jgi:hypothetical protein